mmetsp:Transcript_27736/g.90768  ORF Transcript_27736/g.90768 Transcript_27736/m.90768 type:complete len:208 (+) Transcript_27736:299-922(+)
MVIMVLLKLALICATPLLIFFRSRRLTLLGSRAMFSYSFYLKEEGKSVSDCHQATGRRLLLLACNRLGLALAGAGVGVRALTANGQTVTMTQTTIGTQVHQTFDVHCCFTAQIAFDLMVAVDRFTNAQDFLIGEVLNTRAVSNAQLVCNLNSRCAANSVNIGERNNNALVGGEVYPGNTSHLILHAPQGIKANGPVPPISSLKHTTT